MKEVKCNESSHKFHVKLFTEMTSEKFSHEITDPDTCSDMELDINSSSTQLYGNLHHQNETCFVVRKSL